LHDYTDIRLALPEQLLISILTLAAQKIVGIQFRYILFGIGVTGIIGIIIPVGRDLFAVRRIPSTHTSSGKF